MGKRILLADDSVTIHKVVELTFLDEDYSVEAVTSGDEAIARLEAGAPDLVIADVHMPPGTSGYDVCERTRQLHPGVPVLLLAGTFEPFDADRAEAADAYLKKPFDSQKLLQTVQQLMAEAEDTDAEERPSETAEMSAAAGGFGVAGEPEAADSQDEVGAAGWDAEDEAAEPAPGAHAGPGAEGAEEDVGGGYQEAASGAAGELPPETIEAIAKRVAQLLGDEVVREVAWEVVPDLAEVVIKDRLRELEEQVD